MSHPANIRLRLSAAALACCAVFALVGLASDLGQGSQRHATELSDGETAAVTTPPDTPSITKAEPSITGPAPLYAGEAPDSNPQAQLP